MEKNYSEIMKYLLRDPVKYMSTIGFMKSNSIEKYFFENDSVILFGTSDHLWAHIVSDSPLQVREFLKKYHGITSYFYSLEDWMVPIIENFGEVEWMMKTNRYFLKSDTEINLPVSEVIQLNTSCSRYIFEKTSYKSYTSLAYINDRIARDISAGIILDNMFVAWGLTHDDGALGFLHVLDKYRRRGYGKDIFLSLIRQKRSKNLPVFCNIVPDNMASIELVTKLGFTYDRKMIWLKLK